MSAGESVSFATVEGTVWPINVGEVGYALRYGPRDSVNPLVAASIVSAYGYLTDPSLSQTAAIAALKRARKAVAS